MTLYHIKSQILVICKKSYIIVYGDSLLQNNLMILLNFMMKILQMKNKSLKRVINNNRHVFVDEVNQKLTHARYLIYILVHNKLKKIN